MKLRKSGCRLMTTEHVRAIDTAVVLMGRREIQRGDSAMGCDSPAIQMGQRERQSIAAVELSSLRNETHEGG
jgi:hypothetical protein